MSIAVYGDLDERALVDFAREFEDGLLAEPEIALVEPHTACDGQRSTSRSRKPKLRSLGLTLGRIARRHRRSCPRCPSGHASNLPPVTSSSRPPNAATSPASSKISPSYPRLTALKSGSATSVPSSTGSRNPSAKLTSTASALSSSASIARRTSRRSKSPRPSGSSSKRFDRSSPPLSASPSPATALTTTRNASICLSGTVPSASSSSSSPSGSSSNCASPSGLPSASRSPSSDRSSSCRSSARPST